MDTEVHKNIYQTNQDRSFMLFISHDVLSALGDWTALRYNRNQLQAINHDFGWPTNIYGIQKKSIHVFEKSVRWVYVICGTFIALTCYVFPQCRMLKKDFINRGCLLVLQKGVHDKYSLQWFLNILYNVITIYTLECVIKYFVIIRL